MNDAVAFLSRAIAQGRGIAQADIVLKGGRIFDLVSGELRKSDVAICGDRIVGTLGRLSRRASRSMSAGKIVVPGFIDTHLHVEILADHAARIRPLRARPRRHHRDLRSP